MSEKTPSLKDKLKVINKVMPKLGLSETTKYLKKLLEKRKKNK